MRDALLAGRREAPPGWLVAPSDDACVIPSARWVGDAMVLTTDGLEEEVHFRMDWQEPADLGWKLLAVNLSDIAAKAAIPIAYLLSVSWPDRLDVEFARALARGLREAEAEFGLDLVGGDTDITPGPLRLTAVILGRAERPAPVLRSRAVPGDSLFVTGALGGPAAVVSRLLAGKGWDTASPEWADAARRFRRPVPRLAEARALAPRSTAMMDLSDGLLSDLAKLLTESGLAGRVRAGSVPVHPAAASTDEAWRLATEGGEDYELLLAGPRDLGRAFGGLVEIGSTEVGVAGKIVVEDAPARRPS